MAIKRFGTGSNQVIISSVKNVRDVDPRTHFEIDGYFANEGEEFDFIDVEVEVTSFGYIEVRDESLIEKIEAGGKPVKDAFWDFLKSYYIEI